MRVEERPMIHWVPVTGRDGRRHMEMRWEMPVPAPVRATRAA
jgi:hypothetical protein